MDPFLNGEGTIALEKFRLCPAIGRGFGAVIALDQPLRGGMRDPQTEQVQVVNCRCGECIFDRIFIDSFDANGGRIYPKPSRQ